MKITTSKSDFMEKKFEIIRGNKAICINLFGKMILINLKGVK